MTIKTINTEIVTPEMFSAGDSAFEGGYVGEVFKAMVEAAPAVELPKPEALYLLSDRLDKFADTLPHGALQSDIYAASYIYRKYLKLQPSLAEKIERIRALKTSALNMVIGRHMLNAVLEILEDKA